MDDVIVFGKSFEDHVENIGQMLQRFKEANIKLSPKKCHLFRKKQLF
jgi:hypothetical protein